MGGVTRPDEWGHSPWRVGGENRESEVRAKEDWLRSTGIAGLRKKRIREGETVTGEEKEMEK